MESTKNKQNSKTQNLLNKVQVGSMVKVFAPATIANLVCGFDVLGMALNDPCDEMSLTLSDVAWHSHSRITILIIYQQPLSKMLQGFHFLN